MNRDDWVTLWAAVATFGFAGALVYGCGSRREIHYQTSMTQACEQRAVDGEKARKQLKDERECRELARTAYALLSINPGEQAFIDSYNVSYEKCMEIRWSKP
jgi:hypothetical protein